MDTRRTLEQFDTFLAARGLSLEAVVIGGAALNLLGIVHRATEDCDIIYPLLPEAIVTAAREFAEQQRTIERSDLDRDWLNNGPASLVEVLPSGWEARLQPCYSGAVC